MVTTDKNKRTPCEIYCRCMGYIRPVSAYNLGKKSEFFSRKTVDRYQTIQNVKFSVGDEVFQKAIQVYNEEYDNDNYSKYTLGETEINLDLLSNKSKIPIMTADRTGDFDIAAIQGLMEKWQAPFATLSPNTLTYNNFEAYYTQFIGEIATKGDEYHTLSSNQEIMVNSVQDQRLDVTGVSSDDELTYLIKFQHAYNASARYINVIDDMLEHVIERLGQ